MTGSASSPETSATPVPVRPEQKPKVVPPPTARQPARSARFRLRHNLILLSFVTVVIIPPILAALYLWMFAADQYNSKVGFSVRLEESSSALNILSGLTGISGSSSSDTDILFEYVKSQRLVAEVDKDLNLRAMWSKPAVDPVFALGSDASIEELVDYWNTMVHLTRGTSAGLLEIEVRAFSPEDAHQITTVLLAKSSAMINQLSSIAREDSIRYAREDLDEALERLKSAREAVTRFRNVNQIVNPELDLQTQAGLLATLQTQQAEALIEIDLLRETVRADDHRLVQAERRLQVIEKRIEAERSKMGVTAGPGQERAFADIVGEYERLTVEREFAEQTYVTALASYDGALAEARRQSRYLAAYMEPTLAQTALYPKRDTILIMLTMFLFLGWCIAVLIYYSARDRR